MFFHARHDSLCTTDTLRRAKLNPGKELPNMPYIRDLNSCESFFDRIPIHKRGKRSKGLAKLANIACQTLLFASVSLAMDNQHTLLSGREQLCLASNVGQFRQALRAVHVALKSRKMKTLRDFQKPRYGTAPTVIGQHGTRIKQQFQKFLFFFLH